jgi:predicted TIM-barrel fold metal-dependent hydrolase
MDIVDAQVHINRGRVEATLGAMDALGIRSVLIDEFWFDFETYDPDEQTPGYRLKNGAWRPIYPQAELASITYPDRFAYFVRIDRRDPQLESVMRVVGSSPHARAFRLLPAGTLEEAEVFRSGGYDALLDIAQDIGLPVCVQLPGFVELLPRYLQRYPKLSFVVDHLGMGLPGLPAGRSAAEEARVLSLSYFHEVVKLAEHPNVAIKWSHVQRHLQAHAFPYEGARPFLRRAIEAFGANRIIWASDNSVIPEHSWADMLYAIKGDPELSLSEKQWILGGSARKILDWPAS